MCKPLVHLTTGASVAGKHIVAAFVVSIAAGLCHPRCTRAARARFHDPDTSGPQQEIWQLTDRPLAKHVIEYHNTQCWSPDGRYVAYTTYHQGDLYVYDLHEDRELHLGKGGGPRWAKKHNWLFYLTSTERGRAIRWLDMETSRNVALMVEPETLFMGGTDCEDRWLFVNRRYVSYHTVNGKRKRIKQFTTIRIPIRGNAEPELILEHRGLRPLPNPRHPVVMQRYKQAGKPFGSSRIWFDYDGKHVRTGVPLVQSGHQCWLGNGEFHLVGDDQIRGRRWNEPFPSDMHYLANMRAHDICPCGFSGRWVIPNGKIADLRSGHGKRYSFRYPYTPKPQDVGSTGDTDCNPKGSPDGTKVCFRSMADIKDGVFARVTQSYSKTETQRIQVESTAGFPESGEIVRFVEVIGYKRKTATSFEDLERGRYNTRPWHGSPGVIVDALDSRVVRADQREGAPPNRLQAEIDKLKGKYRDTPLYWLRRQQVFITVVRSPDPPHLRLKNGRAELMPGENHWETRGYYIRKGGKPLTGKPVLPGATVTLPGPGPYTAVAEERSGLRSKPGFPLKLDRPVELVILREKPKDFSWTSERWFIGGKPATSVQGMAAPSATKEIVHRHDGVIHVERFENGQRVLREDLNEEGKATRVLTYKRGKLATREYRHGERVSIEHFGLDGYKTDDVQWYVVDGQRHPYSKWWYDRGTPIKRDRGGRTVVKQGDRWVEQKEDKP